MYTASSYAIGFRFEEIVAKIFRNHNFTAILTDQTPDNQYDILATLNNTNYVIEVKFSRTKRIPTTALFDVACRLKMIADSDILSPSVPILVVGTTLLADLRKRIEDIGVIVIDIQNLLFLVQNDEALKSELLSILDFSVNDILPKEPRTQIFNQQRESLAKPKTQGELLKERISNWDNSNGSTQYEDLCYETLNYLFDNELSLWHRQQTSSSELYRFDLICKIKDGDVSGLWSTIFQCFNSKYIIFEFKNYTDEITQKEIYTTDKYLYQKALRSVAILVSCKGASTNANKAIRGTLRENGKLILSINNSDLLKMIDIKINKGIPADYLYSKFDELLIDLEK